MITVCCDENASRAKRKLGECLYFLDFQKDTFWCLFSLSFFSLFCFLFFLFLSLVLNSSHLSSSQLLHPPCFVFAAGTSCWGWCQSLPVSTLLGALWVSGGRFNPSTWTFGTLLKREGGLLSTFCFFFLFLQRHPNKPSSFFFFVCVFMMECGLASGLRHIKEHHCPSSSALFVWKQKNKRTCAHYAKREVFLIIYFNSFIPRRCVNPCWQHLLCENISTFKDNLKCPRCSWPHFREKFWEILFDILILLTRLWGDSSFQFSLI